MDLNKIYLAKLIQTNNQTYLFDALTNSVIALPQNADYDNNTISDKNYYKLIKDNNLRDFTKYIEFKVDYPYTDLELSDLVNNKMQSITLALTEQCNLRCKYCGYMPKYLKTPCELNEMNEIILIKSVEMLLRSYFIGKLPPSISFYGGEPLLKFDLIKKVIKYCKNNYLFCKPNYYITTNGLLLGNDEIIEFLIENNFYLTVSLDGPQSIQDKYRIQSDGRPSFNKVFENVTKLYKYNPRFFKEHVTFNSVVGPTTGTIEQYEFLEKLCKMEIVLIDCNITNHFSKLIEKEKLTPVDELIKAQNHSLIKKSILKNMQKYHTLLSAPSFQQYIFPGGFCIPGTRKNFITTDGKIIVCEKVNENEAMYQIGDIFNGVDINKVKKLIYTTVEKTQKCKTCWAAKFCSICFKDIFNLTDEFCKKSRNRIERELAYYLENIKNNRKLTNYLDNLSIE